MVSSAFIEGCVHLSELYKQSILAPAERSCPEFQIDVWDSLKFFLLAYAFEHQGTSSDYAPVAAEVIDNIRGQPLSPELASRAWEVFTDILGDIGVSPNGNNCPLAIQGYQ